MTAPRLATVFLDAGGVLVHPNWARVADALVHQGVETTADALTAAERFAPKPFRRRALDTCARRIAHEQEVSAYRSISPVNGLLNTLALTDRNHTSLDRSVAALESWRWEDDAEGVRFAGARSNAWDTVFALQAHLEHGVAVQHAELESQQALANPAERVQERRLGGGVCLG